jgi:CBS domain-containing protein
MRNFDEKPYDGVGRELMEETKAKTVARFCSDPVIADDVDLGEVFSAYTLGQGHQQYVIEHDGHFTGVLSASIFNDIDREDWPRTIVKQVMTSVADMPTVAPDAPLKDVIDLTNQSHTCRVYVIQGGRLLGIIEREDIVEFVEFQSAIRL